MDRLIIMITASIVVFMFSYYIGKGLKEGPRPAINIRIVE